MPIDKHMEKLTPQVRIFGLVAVLVAVGGLLFVYMSGRGAAPDSEVVALPPAASVAKKAKAPAAHKSTTAKPKAQASKAAKAPAAKAKTPAKPAPKKVVPKIPPTGFPLAVDRALAQHKVVVVSLVIPGSHVDELAAGEAKAGAKLGGAGYLALNVLNERVAHAVLAKLGGVKEPSLLVLKRSGEVVLALEGFVDRETVAQAAANAAP
jgi:pyruvate/2-oxoglutarate dehydrogenase complex dihydrolipoamide acyltransferase (E2) component